MTVKFDAIDDEVVGYELKIKQDLHQTTYFINHVRFEDFIGLYTLHHSTPQEVYNALQSDLESEIRRQDEFVVEGYPTPEWDKFVHLTKFLIATLKREAIRNAMQLIEGNYLQTEE